MKLFNRVAIVGTGLIGGSIALAIKKKRLAREVIGVSRHRKTLLLAKQIHAIDKGSQDINIIKDADLVILAVPVSIILKSAPVISKIIKRDCIVSDTGGTKQEIVSRLARILPNYVGSHPLAGSEKRGIINANPFIFKDSLCILTPTRKTKQKTQEKIRRLWSQLGAKVVILSSDTHDKILSLVSHLPHIVAFSLIGLIPKRYLGFASSGLKDATRIAASDSGLWVDIFLSNQKNMIKTIELFQKNLSKIKSAIKKKDKKLLSRILRDAQKKKASLG